MVSKNSCRACRGLLFGAAILMHGLLFAQETPPQQQPPASGRPGQASRQNILRGEYGQYRANNDLLYYRLNVRVEPDRKRISGKTAVRFKMLKDDHRIQLDLAAALKVEKILLGDKELKYERDLGAVFVDFPETLTAGKEYTIDFCYSGSFATTGRSSGLIFQKDPAGRDWIYTNCEGPGASSWWPNKDQWRDEVESMDISVEAPNALTDVSNGQFIGKTDLGDGYTRWDWRVSYPINNYCVSMNIGNYVHFADKHNDLPLDYWVLPEDLEKAKRQFVQVGGMLNAYEHYFGEYPFIRDGYKLIQSPFTGMEHQSAVTYGNRFINGYGGRDWTGVGISTKFDFIIIHESAHEWFGNSVTAADRSDMWIHEGVATYMEGLFVEYTFSKSDGIRYLNGYKPKIGNRSPIVTQRGIAASPSQDQYFKGALLLNTVRSIVDDDERWWKILREFYQRFKYQNIMTEDVVEYFDTATGKNLTPVFNQYLRRAALPVLELKFDDANKTVDYRWVAEEPNFAMPVRVGQRDAWQVVTPTKEWQTLSTSLPKDEFQVATDLYYVGVKKL